MGLYAIRVVTLLWLVHDTTVVVADFSDTGGVTMTQIYTSGQDGAASAATFYPVIYPGADHLNLMTRSNYSAYTTTAPPYVYGPDDFIDCDSCESLGIETQMCITNASGTDYKSRSHPATATAFPASGTASTYRDGSALNGTMDAPTSRTGPITIAPHVTVTPLIPFEEYWCSSYASTIQDSALLSFQNNGTKSPQFHGLHPSAKTICMSVEAENYSKWATTHAPSTSVGGFWSAIRPVIWTPTLTPPCCNTFCNLVVPSAQMQYWPTPAPAAMKNRTTLVGPDRFTYTSPSIYVVYKGIFATNDCGQTLGSTTMDLTLSYAPSDMITFSNRENGYTYKSIDFATIWSNCSDRYTHSSQPDPPCAKTITTEEANCGAQISSIGANVLFWQEHCYPQLSFPPTTRLQELNTAWKMCDMGNVDTSILGVFDPPRALKPGTAMVAPVPTKTPGFPIPPIAEPASQAVPSQPEKTASPGSPQASNDPSSNTKVDPPAGARPSSHGGAADPSTAGGAPPTQTTKEQDPQQAGDSKPTALAVVNTPPIDSLAASPPAADSPVANQAAINDQAAPNNQPATNSQPAGDNQPAANLSPSGPGDDTAAQMSALYQALAPAPATSPQSQGTIQSNGSPQQAAGSPANAPVPANSPAANGGSQPAEPAPNQDQGANPPSSGPASGGSHPASGGSQSASGRSQLASGGSHPASGGSQPASGGSQPANGGSHPASGGSQPASGGSQPANGGSQLASEGSQPPRGGSQSANVVSLPVNWGSQPGLPAQDQGPNPPSNWAASNGDSVPVQVAQNQGLNPATPVPAASPPPQFVIPIANGEPLSGAFINSNSVIIAGSSGGATVQAGAPATQVLGHTISIGPAGSTAIVDGQVHALTMQTPAAANNNDQEAAMTPGTSPDNPFPAGHSQNQSAGGSDSRNPQQNAGGQGPVAAAPPQPFTTTIANHAIADDPSPGIILVDGQKVSHGATPVIISNTPVAYNIDGNLVLGTKTISNILSSIASLPSAAAQAVFTVSGQVASVLPSHAGVAIASDTLLPNAPAVVLSGTVSASYGSAGLVVGTSTIVLPSLSPAIAASALITVAGQVATVLSDNDGVAIAGTTLQENGPAISISGAVSASYGPAGLVVGTSTAAIPPPTPFQESLTSITLAGQVFTYAISAIATASAGSNGVVMGTSTIPYTSTGPNGALILGASTVLYTSTLIDKSTVSYMSDPSGPGSENANGTKTGVVRTSSVAGPTGLVGTSADGSKGQVPVSGAGRVGMLSGGSWISALMAVIGLLCV